MPYSATSRWPSPGSFAGRSHAMLNTSSRGLTYFAGSRWQSRHHDMKSVDSWYTSGIVSTRPWHVAQPTPCFTWMLWLKYTKSGRSLTRVHCSGVLFWKLVRTGSRIGAVFQICEWQFMQVLVGGIFAKADSSTEVWQ